MGLFVDTLVLRSKINPDFSFDNYVDQTDAEVLELFANKIVPFEKIVEILGVERGMSHHPIFQVLFSYQPPLEEISLHNADVAKYNLDFKVSKFDLSLYVEESNEKFILHWEYSDELFKGETITRMASNYKELLLSAITDPGCSIANLRILTDVEKNLFEQWNQNRVDYPNLCLHQLFEQQVNKTPNAVALIDEDKQITYF